MVHQWRFFGSISAIRKIWSLTANSRSLQAAALKALELDSLKYAHVEGDILHDFKQLLLKYPTAFLLPDFPLGEIKGFQHHIDTENALPV